MWRSKLEARAEGPFRPDICPVFAQDGGYLGACPRPHFSTVGAFRQSVLYGVLTTTLIADI